MAPSFNSWHGASMPQETASCLSRPNLWSLWSKKASHTQRSEGHPPGRLPSLPLSTFPYFCRWFDLFLDIQWPRSLVCQCCVHQSPMLQDPQGRSGSKSSLIPRDCIMMESSLHLCHLSSNPSSPLVFLLRMPIILPQKILLSSMIFCILSGF